MESGGCEESDTPNQKASYSLTKSFYLCWDPFHNVVRHQDNNMSLSVEKQALQLDATLTVKDLIAAISASNTAASWSATCLIGTKS